MPLSEFSLIDGDILTADSIKQIVNPIVRKLNAGLDTSSYADYSVTQSKLALSSVGTNQLEDEAVTSAKITPRTIIESLLSNTPSQEAVTEDVIRDAAVSLNKLKTTGSDNVSLLGVIGIGTYTGDGTASKAVTGVFGGGQFTPKVLLINSHTTLKAFCITYKIGSTYYTHHSAQAASTGPGSVNTDQVSDFIVDGFTVKSQSYNDVYEVNVSARVYNYLAIGTLA